MTNRYEWLQGMFVMLLAFKTQAIFAQTSNLYDRVEFVSERKHITAMPVKKAMPVQVAEDNNLTRELDLSGLLDNEEQKMYRKFYVTVPETVVQGQPFVLTYNLEAKTWDDYLAPDLGKWNETERSFDVLDADAQGYSTLQGHHTIVAPRSGWIDLPICKVTVDGEVVESEPKRIKVHPNPVFGRELAVAYSWMESCGIDADSYTLQMERQTNELTLLHDPYAKAFVLVARPDFWDYLDNPVLAYSTENGLQLSPGDYSVFSDVFARYTPQLLMLKAQNKPSVAVKPLLDVDPLLGCVVWGQAFPYNTACPVTSGQHAMVGCVSVAAAQLMKYYNYPKMIENAQWNAMECHYDGVSNDAEDNDVARLMVGIGTALGAEYGSVQTRTDLAKLRETLCNDYGYSDKMAYNAELSVQEQLTLIADELSAGRPCLLSDFGHAFICDGQKADFLHLNLGWNGFCNGYYRVLLSEDNANEYAFKTIISGIQPK